MNKEQYLQILRDFKRERADEYGITRIGIFGSVARNEHSANSDVDIYYEGPSLGLKSLVSLPMELEDRFGRQVDVIRRHDNMSPLFVQRIMGEVVYV